MTIDFTIPTWGIPAALTVVLIACMNWPYRGAPDRYRIGETVHAFACLALGIAGILLTWMLYFAALAWSRS